MKQYDCTFIVHAPFVTRGTAMAIFGIDLPTARNEAGKPVLHGSHVWGKIREALIELQLACDEARVPTGWELKRWIGGYRAHELHDNSSESAGDENDDFNRRRLIHCTDFTVDTPEQAPGQTRTRIALDPVLGATGKGMLQVIEEPWEPGTELRLKGRIAFLMPDDEAERASRAVRKALLWSMQFGALGSIGFGVRTGGVEITPRVSTSSSTVHGSPARVEVVLDFQDEPFFVSERRDTENSFIGAEVIPGGVFIGALVNLLNAAVREAPGQLSEQAKRTFPTIGEALDKITVTHFKPVAAEADERPCSIAHSVFFHGSGIGDAIVEAPLDHEVETFAADMKPDQTIRLRASSGWQDVRRELRIRTGIDPRRRAAKTNALFGLEMCCTSGRLWKAELESSRLEEATRERFLIELQNVLACGLPGIGRGKALARTSLLECDTKRREWKLEECLNSEKWKIVLEAPAAIRRMNETYREALERLSGSALIVEEVFVRERLAGAEFRARRDNIGYSPVPLAEAGSVFVVTAADKESAHDTLRGWYDFGLPSCGDPLHFPYSNSNGYGEIRMQRLE